MSYFSAVIGRSGSGWRALDIDLEDLETLDDVGEQVRAAGYDELVLAVLEREDQWFALIRLEGDEEPRAFVSDLDASERSRYGPLLSPLGDLELNEYAHLRSPALVAATVGGAASAGVTDSSDGVDDERDDSAGGREWPEDPLLNDADADLAAAAIEAELPPPWAGDPGVLEDVGVDAAELVELVVAAPGDPASVVADLGERCGFDELLEALR